MAHTHTVLAQFDEPDEAREAMVDLEVQGIDAGHIAIVDQSPAIPVAEAARGGDLDVSGEVARNYARGGVLGALVGAAILVGVLIVAGAAPFGTALLGGAIAGAAGGFLVGGFWAAASRLPVNVDALDTYYLDPADDAGVCVEVTVEDPSAAATAIAVLRKHHPRQLERRAA